MTTLGKKRVGSIQKRTHIEVEKFYRNKTKETSNQSC